MDDFQKFNFVRINARTDGKAAQSGPVTERVDLIARQFRDFLYGGVADDEGVHGILISNEFKLRRRVNQSAGWLSFLIDVGDGREEKLSDVAVLFFMRDAGDQAIAARLSEYVDVKSLLPAPVAVAVELTGDVPYIIREWYTKAGAGFFAKQF